MTTSIRDLLQNTKEIFMTDSSVNTLLNYERVIDALDLYAFANWKDGELVIGPEYRKYFISCTWVWPFFKMPDPDGAVRLLQYGCKITYRKDYFEHPVTVKSPNDFRPGTKVPKLCSSPVWLVEILMPKSLMQEIHQGAIEIESGKVDAAEIDRAYEQGVDNDTFNGNSDDQDI